MKWCAASTGSVGGAVAGGAISYATAASSAAPQHSHNNNTRNSSTVANSSHVHENSKRIFRNYQSRQRMHRSSQFNRRADRSRTTSELSHSADSSVGDNSQQQIRIGGAGSLGSDEARYNLATRIMSNGVEVIVAGDKSTLPGGGHPNQHLRILTTTDTQFKMPLTLAPSTLKDHMLLMLPQTTSTINNNNKDNGSDDAMHVSI